jgi:hypothetical protein
MIVLVWVLLVILACGVLSVVIPLGLYFGYHHYIRGAPEFWQRHRDEELLPEYLLDDREYHEHHQAEGHGEREHGHHG